MSKKTTQIYTADSDSTLKMPHALKKKLQNRQKLIININDNPHSKLFVLNWVSLGGPTDLLVLSLSG